jgi:hypothetical protein
VVVTFQLLAADDAQVQWHLTMRTAILKREHLATAAAVQNDRLPGEAATQGLTGRQLVRPGEWVPVVRVRAHAPQIGGRCSGRSQCEQV